MASVYEFWQDLELRFRELEHGAASGRLEARYSGENDGQWIFCGSASKDPATTAAFTALAERGAVAAGKPRRLSDWLDLLRLDGEGLFRRSKASVAESPLVPDDPAALRARRFSKRSVQCGPWESIEVGSIANVILASAVYCMARATRAFGLETAAATACVPALPGTNPNGAADPKPVESSGRDLGPAARRGKRGAAPVPRFTRRAVWLKAKLAEREWSKHDLRRYGGPEHRTTQKILEGLDVQMDVLRKAITGLQSKPIHKGRHLPQVSESDIPND
jgi:hypothetical protein